MSFERPEWLVLLVTLIPVGWLAWKSIASVGRPRAIASLVVRSIVLALLAVGLARPSLARRCDGVSVVVVADASRSVSQELREQAQHWLQQLWGQRTNEIDRIGVVTVARHAEIHALPSTAANLQLTHHAGESAASNLAAGLRTALAMLPSDTINRILLLSDGVETEGHSEEVVEQAAALGIPIDVAVMHPAAKADVMVESIHTPSRARRGQMIDARVILRSTAAAQGRLHLRVDDRVVDLDPQSSSDGLRLTLAGGPNAYVIPLPMDRSGAVRVQAFFEPTDPAQDAISENDHGSSITFVAGDGRVLVVDDDGSADALVQAIRASRMEVQVTPSDGLASHVAAAGFDAIVLNNVARWNLDAETDRALRASVHDMGCGLWMVGGDRSFGAGGWSESETAKAIPVEMNPPQERRLPSGALALIIDASGSMSARIAGTTVSQQQMACEAAIKAVAGLTPSDEVTVIAFSGSFEVVVPLTTCHDMPAIERRIRSIESGGGTNLFPALQAAAEQLGNSRSLTRHAIVLTDGQTAGDPGTGFAIASDMANRDMSLSTVSIGDSAADGLLARLARIGNGRFYSVKDEQSRVSVPQILIKEAQIVRRSLVWEGTPVTPALVNSMEWLRGATAFPPLRGYVITGPRSEPAVTGLVSPNDPPDPLVAWWNHGLGRAAACTTDLAGKWTPDWGSWSGFQPFVGGMVRWLLRPTAPSDISIRTRVDGSIAVVELETSGASTLTAESAEGRVLQPDGSVQRLALRQVAPGRWTGRFELNQAGAFVVNAAMGMVGSTRPVFTQASVSVPYPPEFRTVLADQSKLESIARRTGGRVLSIGDPAVELFETNGLPIPESLRQTWDACIMLAAAMFVLDVATRRLSLEWPTRRPADSTKDTVRLTAAWRQARRRARGEILEPVRSGASLPTTTSHGTVSETDSRETDSPATEVAPSPNVEPLDESPLDDSPLGRLREAKRRARRERGSL